MFEVKKLYHEMDQDVLFIGFPDDHLISIVIIVSLIHHQIYYYCCVVFSAAVRCVQYSDII